MSEFWKNKKVFVTGGGGFIGSHLCEKLVENGAIVTCGNISEGHLKYSKFREKINFLKINFFNYDECIKKIKNFDIVMHLAAKVGGIKYNIEHMSDIYIENLLITSNVINAVTKNKIQNVLLTSSACVYPHDAKIPTPESEGFRGIPEETNEGYGWAKRALEISGKLLRKQYGINVAIVRPYNVYGPRDKFDLESAHVIAALINKIFNSKDRKIEVWGSGSQTRSFLYVLDVVKGMMLAMEKLKNAEPVNLGGEEEISIKDLVYLIIKLSGKNITPIFKTDVPEGYKRRKADITLAKEKLGFYPEWSLEEGLKETIKYYKNFVLKI